MELGAEQHGACRDDRVGDIENGQRDKPRQTHPGQLRISGEHGGLRVEAHDKKDEEDECGHGGEPDEHAARRRCCVDDDARHSVAASQRAPEARPHTHRHGGEMQDPHARQRGEQARRRHVIDLARIPEHEPRDEREEGGHRDNAAQKNKEVLDAHPLLHQGMHTRGEHDKEQAGWQRGNDADGDSVGAGRAERGNHPPFGDGGGQPRRGRTGEQHEREGDGDDDADHEGIGKRDGKKHPADAGAEGARDGGLLVLTPGAHTGGDTSGGRCGVCAARAARGGAGVLAHDGKHFATTQRRAAGGTTSDARFLFLIYKGKEEVETRRWG